MNEIRFIIHALHTIVHLLYSINQKLPVKEGMDFSKEDAVAKGMIADLAAAKDRIPH